MAGQLDGRTAFVTGGASGIGLSIARAFAREGARVAIADLQGTAAEAAAAGLGGGALGLRCDVTREDEVNAAVDQAVATFGRLDVLVNNAGLQFVSPLEEFPADKFELLLRVMVVGPFLATKRAFPQMKRQRHGRVLNMASVNGLIGFAGKAAYNSAKHGLVGLTRVTALEGAPHGITANALCPGYVDTPLVRNQLADLARTRGVPLEKVLEEVIYPLVPQRRLLDVEEVARYALFLAADGSGGITGQPVVIDGGYTAQ
ncbi:3-hydroxybutyrate dehydrogenase [Anaeromyxobacter paludicola]|uniref:3-hydroxybutyrate dehydrogenase n=1 Tax=Anaeromyxobacter paludicola TaxID=2918171 RepID=A0ABN6N799_9BACT|nr:3-hydroxybutyrate dehydrogenase [Anaeromyxobacter paludicola]BDG07904.1 3-hydroxybutyrate dehydrogenase [Anaeromyxobacter paludicola]